jgi:hypothetical protein
LEKRQESSYEELIEFQKHEHKDFASPISREQQNRTKQCPTSKATLSKQVSLIL